MTMARLPPGNLAPGGEDRELEHVFATLHDADPTGERAGRVFRSTFDQLYDGQRTGRYSWEQLYKTEKTHFGTLLEINLRREYNDVLDDGKMLDYALDGIELDCKYSYKFGGWMIPPECFGHVMLVSTASDENSEWALGLVRATESHRRGGVNRDGKSGLNRAGTAAIRWLHRGADLPQNVLLQIDPEDVAYIFEPRSGQMRVDRLFRTVTNRTIRRATVATVAQQDDYMKRVRANGGARQALKAEGLIIPGGDFEAHRQVARALGAAVPAPGEFVSIRVVPATEEDPNVVVLGGQLWRIGDLAEWQGIPAPDLPTTRRSIVGG